MSCLKCIKRLFMIREENEDDDDDISLSLYIQKQKDHIYDDDPIKIPEKEETYSIWSLPKNRDKSKYIKGFNEFIINESY